MRPDGKYVVVWEIGRNTSQLRAKIYDPNNPNSEQEIALNAPQIGYNPKIDIDELGNFVVIWEASDGSSTGVYAQRFDQNAEALNEQAFLVNTTFSNAQQQAEIAMNEIGEFVIVWESSGEDGDGFGIFARKYDRTGTALDLPFQVNNFTASNQRFPDVAMNNAGEFVVVWQSALQDNSETGIYAQRFSGNGSVLGTEIQVNTFTEGAQSNPVVQMYPDGSFVVVWESFGQDGSSAGIFGQLFDKEGNKEGEEFQVNSFTEAAQLRPDLALNKEGNLIVAWESYGQDGTAQGVFGQLFQTINTASNRAIVPLNNTNFATAAGQVLPFSDSVYTPNDTDKQVKVAIIDTGVASEHPHLTHAIWQNTEINDTDNCLLEDQIGYDFANQDGIPEDVDRHGTGVNGMLVRAFPNDVQLELMNLKFYENQRGTVFDAVCAIYYAVEEGVDILNLSWGFESSEFPQILYDALAYAAEKDVLIVTSAGNTAKNNDEINKYPANFDLENIIVVTAYQIDEDGTNLQLANYANFGRNNVDIAAYAYVETTTVENRLEAVRGTSLAAPFVARTAALIKGRFPTLSAIEIKDCILNAVDVVQGFDTLIRSGGILNHETALLCAMEKANAMVTSQRTTITEESETPLSLDVYPNPTVDWVNVEFYLKEQQQVELSLYDTQSRLLWKKILPVNAAWNKYDFSLAPSTGIYFLELRSKEGISTKKIVLRPR